MLDAKWHQTIHHHTIEFSKNTHPPTTHPHKGFHQQTRFTPSKPPRLRGNSSSLPDPNSAPQTRRSAVRRNLANPSNPHPRHKDSNQKFRGGQPQARSPLPTIQTLSGRPGRRRGALTRHKLRTWVLSVKSPGQRLCLGTNTEFGVHSERIPSLVRAFPMGTAPPYPPSTGGPNDTPSPADLRRVDSRGGSWGRFFEPVLVQPSTRGSRANTQAERTNPEKARTPARTSRAGVLVLVAGTGFEPATSGL